MYTSVDQVPRRSQWEGNSWPNQPFNCGPTCVAWEADYYRDAVFGIEETRNLATLRDGDGTSAEEQAVMLAKRGVPCHVEQPSMAQLKAHLNTRPVVIGMLMSSIPAAVRGHSFLGVHAVVGRKNAVVNGVSGIMVMDPNFGYGHTPDATNGNRFYPDSYVLNARLVNGIWRRTVVPNSAKAVVGDTVTTVLPAQIYTDGPHTFNIPAGGKVDGWTATGTAPAKSQTFPSGSSFPGDGIFTITQTPARAPQGTFIHCTAGIYVGLYIPIGQAIDAGPVNPPSGDPAAIKKAQNAAAADVAAQTDKYAKEKYP